MFNGKINYKWPFSIETIETLTYQRVSPMLFSRGSTPRSMTGNGLDSAVQSAIVAAEPAVPSAEGLAMRQDPTMCDQVGSSGQ